MKKSTIIIIASICITIFLLIISTLTFIVYKNTQYDKKEILTTSEFQEILNNYNLESESITEKFDDEVNITESINGYKEDSYNIYYLIFNSQEDAKNYYEKQKNNLKTNMEGLYKFKNIELNSYAKFTITSKKMEAQIIRVKNSLIYTIYNIEYKQEVNEIIKKLKY